MKHFEFLSAQNFIFSPFKYTAFPEFNIQSAMLWKITVLNNKTKMNLQWRTKQIIYML